MHIRIDGDRFVIQAPYNAGMVEAIKQIPNRRYNPDMKVWSVPASHATACDLKSLAASYKLQIDPEIEKMASDDPKAVPLFENVVTAQMCPLWKHQVMMVSYAAHKDEVLWHCGMGTGKTRASIDTIQTLGVEKVLVVCPLAVLPAWEKQIRQFGVLDFVVSSLKAGSVKKKMEKAAHDIALAQARKRPVVVIVNYESLWREPFGEWALSQKWPMVILDEAHNIKAPGGKASRYCMRLGRVARKRLALSGTPLPHSPMDAYGLYRFLDQNIFGTSFHRFRMRYAIMGGFQQKQVVGYQNVAEFQRKIDSIRLHVTRDVLDLPDAVHTEIPCVMPPKAHKIYESLEQDFFAMIGSGEVTVQNALVKLLRLQQITSGHVPTDDGNTEHVHTGKEDALETILDGLPVDEPVVVFCRFKHDLEAVHRVCAKLKRGSAELSGARKELEQWQREDGPPVLAAQIRTAREGVDMVRACHCVYFSLGFALSDYEQSLARTHRPGQNRTVNYFHLIVEGTIDRKVYDALQQRKDVITSILGDGK